MFQPVADERANRRRRFGVTEALVVAAILAFGGFTLVADGRQSFDSLVAGFYETLHR